MDLTFDAPVLAAPVSREILTQPFMLAPAVMLVYSLEQLAAEKLPVDPGERKVPRFL